MSELVQTPQSHSEPLGAPSELLRAPQDSPDLEILLGICGEISMSLPMFNKGTRSK